MDNFLLHQFWGIFIATIRIMGVVSFMPGFSEQSVPYRLRILVAASFGWILSYTLTITLPPHFMGIVMICGIELLTGIFLGMVLKVIFSIFEIAGSIMSQLSGLSNVMVTNMDGFDQSSVLGQFFNISGVLVFFIFDLHHFVFQGIFHSYQLFPVADMNVLYAGGEFMTQTVSKGFYHSVQFAMPFIIFGTVVYFAMGVMNKLIPQIQVFFISMPLQIFVGWIVMLFSMGAILLAFPDVFIEMWEGWMK